MIKSMLLKKETLILVDLRMCVVFRFAIYIPLFLPISVPILFSSMAALKWLGAIFRGESKSCTKIKSTDVKNESAICSGGRGGEEVPSSETATPDSET